MIESLSLSLDRGFPPSAACFLWNPGVLWLNLISDFVIALACYTIPILLFYLARRRIGGRIEFESEFGKGSRSTLLIPEVEGPNSIDEGYS